MTDPSNQINFSQIISKVPSIDKTPNEVLKFIIRDVHNDNNKLRAILEKHQEHCDIQFEACNSCRKIAEDLIDCENCQNQICENCWSECESCYEYFCSSCSNQHQCN